MSATLVEAGQPALPSPDPREPKRNLERYGYDLTLMRSSGTEQARHTHRGLELIAVHSGATTVSVGGWMGVLVPGDVLLLDATQVHGVRALSGSYIRTLLHLLPGTVGDFAAIASGNTPRVLSCVDAPVLAHLQSLVAADGMSVAQRQRLLGASLNVLSRQPQRPAWAGLPPTVRTALGCVLDDVTKPGTVRSFHAPVTYRTATCGICFTSILAAHRSVYCRSFAWSMPVGCCCRTSVWKLSPGQ